MVVNQVKTGAILNYVQLIVGVIISIAITPIMLRFLGPSEYGILNLSTSTVAYLSLITLGIGSAFIKFNMKYRVDGDVEAEKKLNGTFLVIYLIMGLVMALVGLALIFSAEMMFSESMTQAEISKIQIVMGITILNMVVALPFSVFGMNINAYEKFTFGSSLNIINTVLSPMIRLPILMLGGLSISLAVITAVLHIVTCIAQMIYATKKIKVKFKFGKIDKNQIKMLLAFSGFILMNQVVDMINWNVGKLILGVVAGTSAVAVFSLGATFNTYTLNFSSAISGVMTPKVHKLIASKAPKIEIQNLFNRVGRIQFILVAFIITAFGFFGKDFIVNFYADSRYEDSYWVALFLIVPLIVPLIQNVGISIQHAMNKHKFRSVLYLGMALVNLGISIPLSMHFGSIGAAIGTCIALLIGNGLIMNIYYHKAIGLNMFSFWKGILRFLPALVLPCLTGSLIMVYADLSHAGYFIGYALLFVVVYGISFYFLGMNTSEKDLIMKPIKSIVSKIMRKKSQSTNDQNNDIGRSLMNEETFCLCSGCRACEQICNKGAITMAENNEGFLYPVIDADLCDNCGLCNKVCPYKNDKSDNSFETLAIACMNKDDEIRENSSSGGVFFELVKYVIDNKGVVFGCEMFEGVKAIHSYAETIEDCKKYRTSKYVQSDIGYTFKQAKEFLKDDRLVLFTGTPCQIDGLKLFLIKDYDNLICMDVVCHGVPSPKVLRKYILELETKYNSKVVSINFRDKIYGWDRYSVKVNFDSGVSYLKQHPKDEYIELFLKNINLRPSCFNCSSNGLDRRSDLSLADFWGVRGKYPEMYDGKGTSLVLINSNKGKEIYDSISGQFKSMIVDKEYAILNNPCIVKSVKPHAKRTKFFNNLDNRTFKHLSKYSKPKLSVRVKSSIEKCIKLVLTKLKILDFTKKVVKKVVKKY